MVKNSFFKPYFAPFVLSPSPTAFTDLYIMWAISTSTKILTYQKTKGKTRDIDENMHLQNW